MTIDTLAAYRIHPIDAHAADALRAAATVVLVADSEPGWPCRQCLRDAHVGEEVVLVSHDPFAPSSTSPYRGAGPIFLHRRPCTPAVPTSAPPAQLTGRRLSVRAFDADDLMIEGEVVEGRDLRAELDRLFADETVERVRIHNAGRGCFAAEVTRVR
jgi:Protein of unknown function (DUF1203)